MAVLEPDREYQCKGMVRDCIDPIVKGKIGFEGKFADILGKGVEVVRNNIQEGTSILGRKRGVASKEVPPV